MNCVFSLALSVPSALSVSLEGQVDATQSCEGREGVQRVMAATFHVISHVLSLLES